MFFRLQAEKGIAQHIDASSVVWTLIDNGKLANQIARLATIVVKIWIASFFVQEELLEGYKREGIDPTPYYWYTDQVH